MKVCNLCGVEKPLGDFYKRSKDSDKYRGRCKDCDRLTKPNDTEYKRAWKLRTAYGLTTEQFDKMLVEQEGVCAICKQECARGTNLGVDHNHMTGEVRQLLCRSCNLVIGYARENAEILRRAAEYITSFDKGGE